MKYSYHFITGETQEIEVSEDQHLILRDADRMERNNNQANTRRHISLNMAQEDEGMQFPDPSSLPMAEGIERLYVAMKALAPDERAIIRAIYFDSVPVGEYARRLGVSQSAVSHRLGTIKKKMKKILSDSHI